MKKISKVSSFLNATNIVFICQKITYEISILPKADSEILPTMTEFDLT